MRILSHRGYWHHASEKNSLAAFHRSFELGFGTETDVRDCLGKLVISHDMPTGGEMLLDDFLKLANKYSATSSLPIALNIKSDGLATRVYEALSNFPGLEYFTFDMSMPDTRLFLESPLSVFLRMSEVEYSSSWVQNAEGIWLDSFETDWFDVKLINSLLDRNLSICVVSPELHGRDPNYLWQMLNRVKHRTKLMLCTDFPIRAYDYFFQTAGSHENNRYNSF